MANRGRVPGAIVRNLGRDSSPSLSKPLRTLVGKGKPPGRALYSINSKDDREGQNSPSSPVQYRSLSLDHAHNNPGHIILTQTGATKRSVLFAASSHLRRVAPRRVKESTPRAAVILATPRHASWLTDEDFMSGLVTSLRPDRKEPADLHVLAAVVDGVASTWPSREMRDGFSIQLGSLHDILPGLWDEATNAPSNPESEPSCLSVLLPRDLTLTLPLANTLFQTGRRSTLLASVWGDGWPKIIEKRSQTVNLSRLAELRRSGVHVPLVPITHPRMILEGLGNILAKIDIEGEPSPASKELQVNIPRLLEARRLRPTSTQGPGPVGVWALVIPGSEIWGPGDRHLNASPETTREALLSFLTKISVLHHSSPAYGKLAYELSSEREGLAWEISPFLDHILQRGAHFHKILSGGGEWGAKASLLSLDPQVAYVQPSEEDELAKFQRSFHGQDNADGAIAKPGDFVQFFVERGPASQLQVQGQPVVSFGVGDPNIMYTDPTSPGEGDDMRAEMGLSKVLPDRFGALSAEALYLRSPSLNTKLDTPWTTVVGRRWWG